MVFHWSVSDSKPPQVCRILLSILPNLKNAVVILFSSLSVPLTSTPIKIGITVTFIFQNSLVLKQGLGFYLSLLFLYI